MIDTFVDSMNCHNLGSRCDRLIIVSFRGFLVSFVLFLRSVLYSHAHPISIHVTAYRSNVTR